MAKFYSHRALFHIRIARDKFMHLLTRKIFIKTPLRVSNSLNIHLQEGHTFTDYIQSQYVIRD
jgi:hypothetical protein